MTAKNRHKSSSGEKSQTPNQDEASKKSTKSTSNGVSGSGPPGPRSGSCLGLFLSAVFYVALIGAAGFAAFHLHQMMEEIRQISAKNGESAQRSADAQVQLESVVQQVETLRSVVDGLESSLGITRVEMEGAISRMKKGEVQTRKVEEALHKLQNDLLRDLSQGITEVKEAREKDFSSLEKTVEERLAEVSQSITASVTEFTEAQGEAQSQLAELKARLSDLEDPSLIKQEIAAIVDTVAEIRASKQAADASVDSLRDQIGAVREELQTRNQEVVSLSQEVESVRTVVQEKIGNLKQFVSAAESDVLALKDRTATLEGSVSQVTDSVHNVEKQLGEETTQALKRSENLEGRVRASEESGDLLSTSLADIATKVESLLAKYDTHESILSAQEQTVDKTKNSMEQGLEAFKSNLEELQTNLAALTNAQAKLVAKDSSLGHQVEALVERLTSLEDSSTSSVKAEQLESLQSVVAGLEDKAAKLEGHEQAIAALQNALQKTTQTLERLSSAPANQNK